MTTPPSGTAIWEWRPPLPGARHGDDKDGRPVALSDFAGKDTLLVAFLCAHCPYVIHIAPELARLGRDYAGRSLAIVGITANDMAISLDVVRLANETVHRHPGKAERADALPVIKNTLTVIAALRGGTAEIEDFGEGEDTGN